jgi:hypothetical protein
MGKDYNTYLQFLAAEYNVMYIGKDSEDLFDGVASYFNSSSKMDINENILEKLSLTLSKRGTNLVIIDVKDNDELAIGFYKEIREYSEDILIMLMFDPEKYRMLFEIIPLVDITVSYPVDKDLFYKRLFTLLGIPYAIKSIGRREIVLKHINVKEESIDKFFDTYEGSSLFISDDLADMVNALNAGELSNEFFDEIANKLDAVANIFSKSDEAKSVTPIYQELASYLRELDVTKIEPQNLKGFDYLAEILSDVSVYLLDMFVDRIFKDVYVFEHSLENNIEFMKNKLQGSEEEDSGELDFF